jgi:dTDP-4-amino-4,6-dideoxygalactose transaminase
MGMIPLYKPYMPSELPELNTILHSGALAYGKWGKLFEQKLGEYIGENRITTISSSNSAMLVALSVIGVQPGDEIIASPMSCLASNQPFATQNLKLVWADIDPKTGTLCPDSVGSKITAKTKAIFHNHYCGYVGHIDEINRIGKEKGIIVVDDATEAFGSEYKGKRLGNTETDMTIFSFQTIRLPNTIEGGAIAFNQDDFYKKAILTRDYGIDRNRFRDEMGEINPTCDISLPGYGATLSEVNSYIGVLQMQEMEELIQKQRKNAEKWKQIIPDKIKSFEFINYRSDKKPNYWVFGLLSPDKNELIKQFRKKGYYASKVHLPNNYYSVFGQNETLPGVEEFYSKFLALPCGWWFAVD